MMLSRLHALLTIALMKLKDIIHDTETLKTIGELNKAISDEQFHDSP